MVCTLIDNQYASLLFSQTFFCIVSVCWAILQKFLKGKSDAYKYLHNAARALSSPSRCFQLSTNLGKDFFRYLWYCDKKQTECGLAWHWWNSTDLGLIDLFNQSKCRNCCLYIIIQKIAPQVKSGEYFQIWFFPPIWGEKMAAFWACACKLSWTLLSLARVQPLYRAGRKESSGTGLMLVVFPIVSIIIRMPR